MGKFVLFVCLALAIACAPSAQAGVWDRITDKAESIQKDVTQKVNDAIKKVESIVEDLKDSLMKFVERIQNVGNKMIENVVNQTSEIANKVNEALNEAKTKGIDVAECAQKNAVLQKTIKEATDATAACVKEQVSQTNQDVNEVFEAAGKTIHELQQILEKLMNCGSKISCYLECAAEASVKSVSGIADITAKAYAVKTKLEQRVVTLPIICGQETLPRMLDTITTQGKETMDCINSKLE